MPRNEDPALSKGNRGISKRRGRHTHPDHDTGQDGRREEKGTTEGGVVGWHHRLDGHESERAPGAGDEQGGLACCGPWGHRESDTAERLNNSTTSYLSSL